MDTSNKFEIKYYRPKFFRRVLANLVDAIVFIFLFVGLFLGARGIVISTDVYQNNISQLEQIRLDSGIYAKDNTGSIKDIITVLNNDDAKSATNRKKDAIKAINNFLTYSESVLTNERYIEIKNSYDEFRLSKEVEGAPLFVVDGNTIIENSELTLGDNYYYKNVYSQYIDKYCQGYLIKYIPNYYDLNKYISNILIYGEILPSYLLSGLLVYFVPTLFFRRGRKTLGKALYKIGLVDKRLLNCSFKRSIARFAIFYFGELVLSLLSFGLPYIVSFSIMVFSKKKQGFADYMLGLEEVDTSRTKIFYSKEEIKLEEITPHKKPVDFRLPTSR